MGGVRALVVVVRRESSAPAQAEVPDDDARRVWMREAVSAHHDEQRAHEAARAPAARGRVGTAVGHGVPRDEVGALCGQVHGSTSRPSVGVPRLRDARRWIGGVRGGELGGGVFSACCAGEGPGVRRSLVAAARADHRPGGEHEGERQNPEATALLHEGTVGDGGYTAALACCGSVG